MKNKIIKDLKVGSCSYAAIHFKNQYQSKKPQSSKGYFSSNFIKHSILNDTDLFQYVEDDVFWQSVLFDPCFIQYCCKNFELSISTLMCIYSSTEFRHQLHTKSYQYIGHSLIKTSESITDGKDNSLQIEKFVSMLMKIILSVISCYNNNGNLRLSHQFPKTWMKAFNFISKNFSSVELDATTKSFQCSFPFSSHIAIYLKQYNQMQGIQHPGYRCKFLLQLIDKSDKVAIVHLIRDFIFLSNVECSTLMNDLASKLYYNYVLDYQDICKLSFRLDIFKNIFGLANTNLDHNLESNILMDIIFGCPKQTENNIDSLIKNFANCSNYNLKEKTRQKSLMEFIFFHFMEHKNIFQGFICKVLDVSLNSPLITNPSGNNTFLEPFIEIASSVFISLNCYGDDYETFCYATFSLMNSNHPSEIPQKYFSVLLTLICQNSQKIKHFKELIDQEFRNSQSFHRTARFLIIACNELNIEQLGSIFYDFELYEFHRFDYLLQIMTKHNDEKQSITGLIKEIFIKRVLENYSNEVLTGILSEDSKLVHLFTNHHQKLLCLKSLVNKFGLSILDRIKKKENWFFENDFKQSDPDYFKLLGKTYIETRQAIMESDAQKVFQPTEFMLSSFYLKEYGKVKTELMPVPFECSWRILDFNQVATLRNLDRNVLFGCELVSWEHNASPLFLVKCYMDECPGNPISDFLYYVHHFPIRIGSLFLPTMREDIFSEFKETLGEKFAAHSHHLYTWYKCASGHVYAINNCGEPQQTGKCFCGGQIGGLKHTLSEGNRRWDSPNEFNEKGYNLPPVDFHSSIDSERNLNGLSLAFFRWLLHAALISSPKIQCCAALFGLPDCDDVNSMLQKRLANDFEGIKESLKQNTENSLIWMITSIKHIFKHIEPTKSYLDYTEKGNRDKLENIYLDIITPFVTDAKEIVIRGKSIVFESDDNFIKEIVGLEFPEDGPGPCEIKEYLLLTKSITQKLEDYFMKHASARKYPVLSNYLHYRHYISLLYEFPAIIKVLFKIINIFKNKLDEDAVRCVDLTSFMEEREWELWNKVWLQVKSMPKLIDNIYVAPEYLSMKLSANSKATEVLPSISGPGVCSWYMVNTLITFNNIFASGYPIDVVALTMFVNPPKITNHEIVAATYDGFNENKFDLNFLEDAFTFLLNVNVRDTINHISATQLLFTPLKCKDVWFKLLKDLPKEKCYLPENNITFSPEHLISIEITIQLSCTPGNVLTVEDISSINKLNVPPAVCRNKLYYYWHQCWYHYSSQLGQIFIPTQLGTDLSDFMCVVDKSSLKEIKNLFSDSNLKNHLLRLLHMMIVEWIIYYPGFDCKGLNLGEALDFFSEYSNFPSDVSCFLMRLNNLQIEESIFLWNHVFESINL